MEEDGQDKSLRLYLVYPVLILIILF